MRKEENGKLQQVICNGCGKELKIENEIVREGCFAADVRFGYFSRKDGLRHNPYVCRSGGRNAGDRAFIDRKNKKMLLRQDCEERC